MEATALDAIDIHVHVEQHTHGCYSLDDELMDASAACFKSSAHRTPTLAHIADHYRARHMAAVVFTVDATAATGHPALSSEEIADQAAAHPDVLIPFGSVDPHAGQAAIRRARRLVTEHGVRGFKFHPSLQAFQPNDIRHYPLYETLAELGAPALPVRRLRSRQEQMLHLVGQVRAAAWASPSRPRWWWPRPRLHGRQGPAPAWGGRCRR
jgi:predicted TIM-barrel fold metal-dependent hydrolase